MKEKGFFKRMLDYTAFRCLLAILSLFGGIVTIYTIYAIFIKENAPKFEYEILSDVSIFNNTEDISSIRIFVDGIDVQKNNLNIKMFTVKMINNGDQHINHDSYDICDFGLKVHGGYIIEQPTLIGASTDHIKDRYKELATKQDSLFLHMPYLPLDVDDYYILKYGILHDANSTPHFTPVGKISGQKKIEVTGVDNPRSLRGINAITRFDLMLVIVSLVSTLFSFVYYISFKKIITRK